MPRPKSHKKIRKWTLHIQEETAQKVEELLADPITGGVLTGARAMLIERLLEETIAEIQQGRAAFDPFTGRLYRKKE